MADLSDFPSLPKRLTIRVVGVSFVEGYPESLGRLEAISVRAQLEGRTFEPVVAVLVRRPMNAYDENAIEVHVPAVGGAIGHVPRTIAARLAPRLDGGETWRASVSEVVTNPNRPELPGVNVRLERMDPS